MSNCGANQLHQTVRWARSGNRRKCLWNEHLRSIYHEPPFHLSYDRPNNTIPIIWNEILHHATLELSEWISTCSEIPPQDATCLPKLLSPLQHRCIHRRNKTRQVNRGWMKPEMDQPHLLSIPDPLLQNAILVVTAASWRVDPICFSISTQWSRIPRAIESHWAFIQSGSINPCPQLYNTINLWSVCSLMVFGSAARSLFFWMDTKSENIWKYQDKSSNFRLLTEVNQLQNIQTKGEVIPTLSRHNLARNIAGVWKQAF